jgi:hypothetical protein
LVVSYGLVGCNSAVAFHTIKSILEDRFRSILSLIKNLITEKWQPDLKYNHVDGLSSLPSWSRVLIFFLIDGISTHIPFLSNCTSSPFSKTTRDSLELI